jgi:methyl-accepting chemotaxis protein
MENINTITRLDLSNEEIAALSEDEMKVFIATLQYERAQFVQDIRSISTACKEGDLHAQMDASEYHSDLRSAGDAVNDLISYFSSLQIENEKLKNQSAWYESILDAFPFPVSVTDLNMNWTFLNPATAKMANVDKKQAVGTQCNRWNANICRTKDCGIESLRAGKKETFFEQDGGHFKVDVGYVKDASGKDIGHVEVIQDITAIVKMQKEMENKAAWYESILDSVPFPISVTDMNMNWTFFNRSVEMASGVTRKEGVGKPCSTWNTHICKTDKCTMHLFQKGINNTLFEQDGRQYRIECAYVTDASGNKTGMMEILIDITGMQKILQYLDQSISLVSDDLGKIAAGNTAFTTRVLEADDDTREVREKLVIISDSVELVRCAIESLVSDANLLSTAAVEGKLETRADASKHQGDFRKIVEGVNDTLDSVINPLNIAANYVDRISKGDIPTKITDTYNGDFNVIKNNLNTCIDAVNLLVSDAGMLAKAAVEGKLDTRADDTKHQGDFRVVVKGVNDTLDSVIGPLNVAAEYVDRISKGDIPPKITDTYNGDFNEIKNNLNTCIDAVNLLVGDAGMLAKAAVEGKLKTRADASKHQGDFRKIVEGVNDTLDSVINPLNIAANYVDRISKGDIPPRITDTYNGDFNEIKNNLNTCIDAVNLLVGDAGMLAKAAVEGKLKTRADASKHQGDFRKIVEGVNDTLDSVINPLNDMTNVLKRMTVNDYTRKLEQTYQGDFASVAADLNMVMNRVNHIADSIVRIGEGDLSELDEYRTIGKRSDEDKVIPGFIQALGMLKALQDELLRLTQASQAGELSERGRPEQFKGAYADVIKGTNKMLDEILLPIGEGNRILEQIRGGNLRERVEIVCHGDHEKMKDAINGVHAWLTELIQYVTSVANGDMTADMGKASDKDQIHEHLIRLRENIKALVSDANLLAKAAVEGKLETRADASKHLGDFRKIVLGVNDTLDSVIVPVKEALRVSKEYSNYQFKARVDPSLKVAGDWIEFKNVLDDIGIQISAAVGIINSQVLNLASNAEEATASIEEVSAGAQQIAKNAGGVSDNAERGNEGIVQVLKAMEDLTITVSEVSQRAEQVSVTATQANEFSKMGIDLARRSETSMTEITRSSTEVDQIVKDINQQMEEIGKIVRLISDIANQTNLLALNAAIEAARAGEAGRGFAVVAAEVKSLAQDSRQSAENIADMISTLQDKAKKATIAMAMAGEKVEEGSKSLTETLGAFNKIASSIEDITRNAMDVASASEEQAASVEEVTASINEVSVLIVNTSTEAGNAAAATQEASASIEQISRIVTNVSGAVDSVSSEMAKFVI